jgi:hypothetical protein
VSAASAQAQIVAIGAGERAGPTVLPLQRERLIHAPAVALVGADECRHGFVFLDAKTCG